MERELTFKNNPKRIWGGGGGLISPVIIGAVQV